jgi:hypothetical protein
VPDKWHKYDPTRGYYLCEACWNYAHFSVARDPSTGRNEKRSMCVQSICSCPCTGRFTLRRQKFTGEGQTELPKVPPLNIGPKS